MKVLAIDAGNTRVKWGIHDGGEWFLRGSHETAASETGAAAHARAATASTGSPSARRIDL